MLRGCFWGRYRFGCINVGGLVGDFVVERNKIIECFIGLGFGEYVKEYYRKLIYGWLLLL